MGFFPLRYRGYRMRLRRRDGVPANRSERIDIRVRFVGGEWRGKPIRPNQ